MSTIVKDDEFVIHQDQESGTVRVSHPRLAHTAKSFTDIAQRSDASAAQSADVKRERVALKVALSQLGSFAESKTIYEPVVSLEDLQTRSSVDEEWFSVVLTAFREVRRELSKIRDSVQKARLTEETNKRGVGILFEGMLQKANKWGYDMMLLSHQFDSDARTAVNATEEFLSKKSTLRYDAADTDEAKLAIQPKVIADISRHLLAARRGEKLYSQLAELYDERAGVISLTMLEETESYREALKELSNAKGRALEIAEQSRAGVESHERNLAVFGKNIGVAPGQSWFTKYSDLWIEAGEDSANVADFRERLMDFLKAHPDISEFRQGESTTAEQPGDTSADTTHHGKDASKGRKKGRKDKATQRTSKRSAPDPRRTGHLPNRRMALSNFLSPQSRQKFEESFGESSQPPLIKYKLLSKSKAGNDTVDHASIVASLRLTDDNEFPSLPGGGTAAKENASSDTNPESVPIDIDTAMKDMVKAYDNTFDEAYDRQRAERRLFID